MVDLVGLAMLTRTIRRIRPHIVHAHLWDSNVLAAVAGTLAGVPVFVAHEHTWSFEGHRVRKVLDRHLVARRASAFVCVSEADRRKTIAIERIPPERIRVIPNGVNPAPPTGKDVRREFGIPPTAPVVGVVSVFRRQKRLDVLLEAVAEVRAQRPDLRVLIAGDDAGRGYRAEMENLARSLAITDAVYFLGLRGDIPDLLATVDVACLSSDYEGMPLAVLEYMAAGKPTVSTAVGGVPELLRDGIDGILVDRRDPAALARAILDLLSHPDRAARMGAAAAERQRLEFSLEAMVSRFEALYDELFAQAMSRRRRSRSSDAHASERAQA
jgi:glycosyltransferase involved in cell wall biosynthesis